MAAVQADANATSKITVNTISDKEDWIPWYYQLRATMRKLEIQDVVVEALNLGVDDGFALFDAGQLRKYINEQLGFNHFSQFLNHHRLDHVVMQFKQADQVNTPILTLALNSGFNSIGPFNRAFKARFNTTPSQYRKQLFLD